MGGKNGRDGLNGSPAWFAVARTRSAPGIASDCEKYALVARLPQDQLGHASRLFLVREVSEALEFLRP